MRWHESYNEETEQPEKKNLAGGPAAPVRNMLATTIVVPRTGASAAYRPEIAKSEIARPTVAFQNSPVARVAPRQADRPSPVPVRPATQSSPLPINRPKIVRDSGYEAVCAGCGKNTTTIFVPDGIRPVYCKECLSRKKEEKRIELEKRQIAKEIEKKHLEEETVLVENTVPLSLADLIKVNPVDFRGKEIKNAHPIINSDADDDGSLLDSELPDKSSKEQELSEGIEINISNNKF